MGTTQNDLEVINRFPSYLLAITSTDGIFWRGYIERYETGYAVGFDELGYVEEYWNDEVPQPFNPADMLADRIAEHNATGEGGDNNV